MNDERTKAAATAAQPVSDAAPSAPDSGALRHTRQSVQPVGALFVDTLHRMLDADGYHVSRATVYNTMEILVDAGLVRRHNFGSTPAQYEK